jgi:hypothetical protein
MTWLWVILAVVIVGAGALIPAYFGKQSLRTNDEAIAARSRHNQLGLHVETPPPTDDERVSNLLSQARERWVTAGSVLADARSEEDFKLAEQICDDGLALVAQAREPGTNPG